MSTQTKSKAAKPAAKAAAKPAEAVVKTEIEATKAEAPVVAPAPAPAKAVAEVVKTGEDAAKVTVEAYEQVVESTREQVEKANAALAEGYEELAALQQDSLDALIKASTVWAKGAESLGRAYLAYAEAAAEAGTDIAKALLEAKSFKEFVDLQSDYARKSFDTSVSEGTKLSEMSIKVANEAFQPIQEQFNVAVERALKKAA